MTFFARPMLDGRFGRRACSWLDQQSIRHGEDHAVGRQHRRSGVSSAAGGPAALERETIVESPRPAALPLRDGNPVLAAEIGRV
jgi:hypothetical protein